MEGTEDTGTHGSSPGTESDGWSRRTLLLVEWPKTGDRRPMGSRRPSLCLPLPGSWKPRATGGKRSCRRRRTRSFSPWLRSGENHSPLGEDRSCYCVRCRSGPPVVCTRACCLDGSVCWATRAASLSVVAPWQWPHRFRPSRCLV